MELYTTGVPRKKSKKKGKKYQTFLGPLFSHTLALKSQIAKNGAALREGFQEKKVKTSKTYRNFLAPLFSHTLALNSQIAKNVKFFEISSGLYVLRHRP